MFNLESRSGKKECIDLGHHSEAEYRLSMDSIGRINHLLLADYYHLHVLKEILADVAQPKILARNDHDPASVLIIEVGCWMWRG